MEKGALPLGMPCILHDKLCKLYCKFILFNLKEGELMKIS